MTCQEITSADDRNDCLALRHKVFVVEQNVPAEREVDGLDNTARHFFVKIMSQAVATCRVRIIGNAAKIERVAVLKEFRGKGIGMMLMKYILQELAKSSDIHVLKLSSQNEAVPFYEKLGFEKRGQEYMDAGIPHCDMLREL